MEKKFAFQPAKSIKNIKTLVAKHESNTRLTMAKLAECCEAGPVIDRAVAVFSL
ncbi:hypothetical protein [Spirosoma koreense]